MNASEQILHGLNPQQAEAVVHLGAPLCIIAGAGSGKTSVITRRVAWLLAERQARPGEILAITFTNKAAGELKERVGALVGGRMWEMWVSTFHSSCARFLRAEASAEAGFDRNFTIYDSDDSKRLLSMVAEELELDSNRFPPRMLAAKIGDLKNELITPEAALAGVEDPFDLLLGQVYRRYQERLAAANAMDFDDLIMRAVQLLQTNDEVAERWRARFRHVLVDEYQDTNHAQYVLIRELVGAGAGTQVGAETSALTVVGDSDQSIYRFRGATIRNIEEFERDFPNARTVLLEQNYRSTQNILSAANAVIAHNEGRREKRLWTEAGDGRQIVGYVADHEHDEAGFIATEIAELVRAGAKHGDIAVFYRTNNASRVFEEAFIRHAVPYRVVGGQRFYDRREVRDVIAYLRVIANPSDAVSLTRIINTPRRGVGDKAQAQIASWAGSQGKTFWEGCQAAAEGAIPALAARSQRSVAEFVAMLAGLRDELSAGELTVGELVAQTVERSGYRATLADSTDPQDGARLENLDELISVAVEYGEMAAGQEGGAVADGLAGELRVALPPEEEGESGADGDAGVAKLRDFLEQVSLVADSDRLPEGGSESGVVTLMTLHTAKGLEFPVVFMTGLEEGQFPHLRSLGDPVELAEERRLAYVGITRAREQLYVSRSLTRTFRGSPMTNPPSRFLIEIPPHLVSWRRGEPDQTWAGFTRSDFGSVSAPRAENAAPFRRPAAERGPRPRPNLRHESFEVGDRVNHDKYGLGKVVASSGHGAAATVTVDFGSSGTMKLMLIGGVPMSKL
ncbi:UvrD-helicase domain-containing protein [Segniliparus rugosus]|uniref:DNA 3'-5' helicase n=1 Tax=Segniliparus rugosus (strain ATCC BAA-974 / DSM 45345 / CCUG 50838 / CIP 108380 / JCM 13579 / CDC 945) TaxID=679197 RepID=E5XTE3_SEGRC|nr:UvrD-helicase domain-containing protein [Segniliparus rugosus]EFV12405.2 ATP-dependent DNA helicase PcrA [Segniliparus rugosus ATCC BAA-974]